MLKNKIVTVALAVSAAGSALLAVTPATAEAAPSGTRVIITPGQSVSGVSMAPAYQQMAQDLTSRGYPSTVVDVKGVDLRADAAVIGGAVDRLAKEHPRDKIAIVTHSISGISARWYLKEMGGHKKVDTYVAVGTAQYGSPASCDADIAKENCPGTSFMKKLNAGDDTPGQTKYTGVRSAREFATGHLDGGQCRVKPIPATGVVPPAFEHTIEPLNPDVQKVVAETLKGKCYGRFVDEADGVLTGRNQMLPDAPYYKEHRG
ncbi:MAG: lipase [Gordonia sp. (in: high G+C Gram-positive bacteria)]|uniref:esterase/lipase family protein n=1 Tax=Gordonia sp. (in: high G+C Gram-positive bacteria) TaxID=84139 RepID=UPI0039E6E664